MGMDSQRSNSQPEPECVSSPTFNILDEDKKLNEKLEEILYQSNQYAAQSSSRIRLKQMTDPCEASPLKQAPPLLLQYTSNASKSNHIKKTSGASEDVVFLAEKTFSNTIDRTENRTVSSLESERKLASINQTKTFAEQSLQAQQNKQAYLKNVKRDLRQDVRQAYMGYKSE